MAIREGLLLAKRFGLQIQEMKIHSFVAVQVINNSFVSLVLDSIVYDIRKLLIELGDGTCRYISHQRNGASPYTSSIVFCHVSGLDMDE